ncbi:hypothetical protein [Cupriavidus sp. UYPR2.512]|uniref:hypothetical protein n=1 Tax=Cupriavidus sp. UYPR2.512 TaxID=1080187 RepID=UPI00036C7199|nr:hypothetical protein [Cupriavidus sp. UYPR2.512]UIF90876.1 hypothetical protein KAF44_32325 [Cupriavidus necator]
MEKQKTELEAFDAWSDRWVWFSKQSKDAARDAWIARAALAPAAGALDELEKGAIQDAIDSVLKTQPPGWPVVVNTLKAILAAPIAADQMDYANADESHGKAWWAGFNAARLDAPSQAQARGMVGQPREDLIFAWAVFDGEGSYDLRLFEGNESFRRDYINRNGAKYADWVIPLAPCGASASIAADHIEANIEAEIAAQSSRRAIRIPADEPKED